MSFESFLVMSADRSGYSQLIHNFPNDKWKILHEQLSSAVGAGRYNSIIETPYPQVLVFISYEGRGVVYEYWFEILMRYRLTDD